MYKMYKIYKFFKEPGEDCAVHLAAETDNRDIAYERILAGFTTSNRCTPNYYCFAVDDQHADDIRKKLWYHIQMHEKHPGCVLYTVYAYNKISKTLEVYPMHIFTEYDNAVKEVLDFGSMFNDWIFVVATSRNQAITECAYYHANQTHAKKLVSASSDTDIFETLQNQTSTNTIYKPVKLTKSDLKSDTELDNLVETEEKCYYSDGMLYMREIREYYKTDDMEEK